MQQKADKLPNDLQSNKIFLPILVHVPCFISNSNSVYFTFCMDRQAFIQLGHIPPSYTDVKEKLLRMQDLKKKKNGNFTSSQIRQ